MHSEIRCLDDRQLSVINNAQRKQRHNDITLKMKAEVGTVIGFFDIPPYVTMVPPCLEKRLICRCIVNNEKNKK